MVQKDTREIVGKRPAGGILRRSGGAIFPQISATTTCLVRSFGATSRQLPGHAGRLDDIQANLASCGSAGLHRLAQGGRGPRLRPRISQGCQGPYWYAVCGSVGCADPRGSSYDRITHFSCGFASLAEADCGPRILRAIPIPRGAEGMPSIETFTCCILFTLASYIGTYIPT